MLPKKRLISVTILLLMFPLTSVYTAETVLSAKELPEPLTLEIALKLIDLQHPDLRNVDADLQIANSNLQRALSVNDLNIKLKADARWIEPSKLALNKKNEETGLRFRRKTAGVFGKNHQDC